MCNEAQVRARRRAAAAALSFPSQQLAEALKWALDLAALELATYRKKHANGEVKWKVQGSRCWKITEKVSFNIASQASYTYNLSRQKSTQNFWSKYLYMKKKHSWCLKITGKVSFNIASEASYVYILSGQKFIKNAQRGFFETWSLRSLLKWDKNCWKCQN